MSRLGISLGLGATLRGPSSSGETLPPDYADIAAWWNRRTADFTTRGTGKLINSWTDRKGGAVIAAARAAVPGIVIVCCTMLNKASFTAPQQADQATFNTYIRSQAGVTIDYVVDTQAIADLSNSADGVNFALDEVHTNSLGNSKIAFLGYADMHAVGLMP